MVDAEEQQRIAVAWIAHVLEFRADKTAKEHFWAAEKMWDLNYEDPETAWIIILRILAIDDSGAVMENLSAGPLEDLLVKHGPRFIGRIEQEATKSPKFASLLGGVWRSNMTEDIWQRVQSVWDRRGWDGIPPANTPVNKDAQ